MPLRDLVTFSIQELSVLDQTGTVDPTLEPQIGRKGLLKLYRAMCLARQADDRRLKLQRQGRIGTFPPTTGQEAAVCGPVFAMSPEDWYAIAFRDLGGQLLRGQSLVQDLLYYGGYEEGNVDVSSYLRNLPTAIPIASQCLHAVGIGYAIKYRKIHHKAVVCCFGDGATSEGAFHEALNFAGVWQLPIVFVCQNNQWAISTPLAKQTRSETIAQKAIAYGIHGIRADGNDVLAMVQVTRNALDRAYAGQGPTLVEALTYRLRMHSTADDPTKYRSEDEVHEWEKRDPIARYRTYLQNKGVLTDEIEQRLVDDIQLEIDSAVKQFESIRDFKADAPFDHIYGQRYPEIEAQREEFLKNLAMEKADAKVDHG